MRDSKKGNTQRRRNRFLPDEDSRLRTLVEERGESNWEEIASLMPGRNPRQCRERWKHYLSSSTSNKEWTEEEDAILKAKYAELGPKWTKLTSFLPGRTDIQIKTRWMTKFNGAFNPTYIQYMQQRQYIPQPPVPPPQQQTQQTQQYYQAPPVTENIENSLFDGLSLFANSMDADYFGQDHLEFPADLY